MERKRGTMTRRHLLALATMILTAALLAGCANRAAAPAQPGMAAKSAQDNSRISPEARQRMIQAGQAQQRGGRVRGQLMHRSQPQPQ